MGAPRDPGRKPPLTVHHLNQLLLVCSLVLLVAVAAVRISSRSGLPSLLVYLGIGVLMGSDGIAHIHFDNAEMTQVIGYAALVVILSEGGLGTKWKEIKPALPSASALATVGVAVSVGVTAASAHYLVGLEWRQALIIGAVVSSTDAAAVFSVLRKIPLLARDGHAGGRVRLQRRPPSSSSSSPSPRPAPSNTGTSCSARYCWSWPSAPP
ncbi:hypothetical protein GCM10020256_44620 [Streptomyces thermocoprophilus]